MVVQYFGDGYFRIASGEATLLIDPPARARAKGGVRLITKIAPGSFLPVARDEVRFPGEYELEGWEIEGVSLQDGASTVYAARREDITMGIFGALRETHLGEVMEKLGSIDIFVCTLPSGKDASFSVAEKALKALEPPLAIVGAEPREASRIMEKFNSRAEQLEKVTVKRKDLTEGERLLVLTPLAK
ncbi:hypothetical protein D6779_09475 [Candidatus Parcubacteria bacterium]|nr:MAG: hypothetical protein D6779_09475 [Candidatus Parcubacteria bacterium]